MTTDNKAWAWLVAGVATLGFALNFWAWALLSPLGPRLRDYLGLSAFQQALVVAVPVVAGALGRIPVGALTDRFGGRVMFPLVSAVTILPVLFLGLGGQNSLSALIIGGFFLVSVVPRSPSESRSSAPGSLRSSVGSRSVCSARVWATPPSAH